MNTVTFFITSLSSGGAERQVSILSDLLIKKGYNVEIATFADIKDKYIINKYVKRINIGKNKNKIIKFLLILVFFLRHKTDCFISYGKRENLFALLPLLFRRKIKIIASERSYTVGKLSIKDKFLLYFLYGRADFIVTNSYSQKEFILSKNVSLKGKTFTIINYTDPQIYKVDGYLNNDILRVGILARYSSAKNYERFVRAVQIVKNKTSLPFVIEWYGNIYSYDTQLNPHYIRLKSMVENLNLKDIFILHDNVSDVVSVIKKCDACCLPSIYEGFSNSISEAISCGRPMLASNVSDNKVLVRHGFNGYLFNPVDIEDIANKLLCFISLSKEDKYKMSVNSRQLALELFDEETFVGQYIDLINCK